MRVIHQGQIKIDVDIPPEVDVVPAPVGVQRRLDVTALADLGKQLPKQGRAPLRLGGRGVIELPQALQTAVLLGHNALVARR